jgi:hypothetical protein
MLPLTVMGYVPKNAKWYIADMIEEIRVQGDRRNVVHTNRTLIRADSPNEAYRKALALGKQGNARYKNPAGKMVTIKFRGLAELDVIHDELEHGSEIAFSQDIAVSERSIKSWIAPKRRLALFAPMQPRQGPDYASAEIMNELYKRWPDLKKSGRPRRKKSPRAKINS